MYVRTIDIADGVVQSGHRGSDDGAGERADGELVALAAGSYTSESATSALLGK